MSALTSTREREQLRGGWLSVVASLVARFSWGALASFGAALGFLAGSILRIRRRAVVAAMRRAGVEECASRMYAELGAGVFELLWLSGSRDWTEAVESFAIPTFGGPCVLAASHTSNWELAAAVIARRQPIAIVAKAISSGSFHAFCMELRSRAGLEVIAPEGALANAKRMLDRGGVVAMPIDQVPDRTGLTAAFLGADAVCDRAPAALAFRAKVPMVVIAIRREGRRQIMDVIARIEPDESMTARTWIDQATREATEALARWVEKHPSAWMWLHRRWRAPLLARREKQD